MWSEWRIELVVQSDTPSPEEKVTHSFKAWKNRITSMDMLLCYVSPSDQKEEKISCFDYNVEFDCRFCPPF